MEIRTSGGEIMGLLKLKADTPADLTNSLKADDEDRTTDHAKHVQVKKTEEVATLTATIETNLRQGDIATEVAPSQVIRRCPSGRRSARRTAWKDSGADC